MLVSQAHRGIFSSWYQGNKGDTIQLYDRPTGGTSPLSTSGANLIRQIPDGSPTLTVSTAYDMSFTVTRNSATEYGITAAIGNAVISNTTTVIHATSFDTAAILNTPTGIDSFTISNLQIHHSPVIQSEFINFNDYSILSYGDSQDIGGSADIEDGGATLHLTGNVWKCIQRPYTITPDTVLEFDFQSSVEGEEHSLGMDNNLVFQPDNRIKLYGTQPGSGTGIIVDFNNYISYAPNTRHYVIPIGQYYTGLMEYLFFVNDHDSPSPTAESIYSNVMIYETEEHPPAAASNPLPADTATDVMVFNDLSLSWSAGSGSTSHTVYFGTDYNGVLNADENSAEYFKGNQTETTFTPQLMELKNNLLLACRCNQSIRHDPKPCLVIYD